jgi:hypothetical protein
MSGKRRKVGWAGEKRTQTSLEQWRIQHTAWQPSDRAGSVKEPGANADTNLEVRPSEAERIQQSERDDKRRDGEIASENGRRKTPARKHHIGKLKVTL